LYYFDGNNPNASLEITCDKPLIIDIRNWNGKKMNWVQTVPELSSKPLVYVINQLKPDVKYSVIVNGKLIKKIKSDLNGNLIISYIVSNVKERVSIRIQD
jgi:hypothetical protein